DASLLHPDQAATLMEAHPGEFHVLYRTNDLIPVVSAVWYADKKWVEENPEMAQAVSIASLEAARWAYDDKDGFLKTATEYVPKLSETVIEGTYEALTGMKVWDVNGGLTP